MVLICRLFEQELIHSVMLSEISTVELGPESCEKTRSRCVGSWENIFSKFFIMCFNTMGSMREGCLMS